MRKELSSNDDDSAPPTLLMQSERKGAIDETDPHGKETLTSDTVCDGVCRIAEFLCLMMTTIMKMQLLPMKKFGLEVEPRQQKQAASEYFRQ